jgi:cytochrome c-type biogenesis protein
MSILSFMEMMGTGNIPLLAAFFIGLMTAISPCPLATNITAIAYVSRRVERAKVTILTGVLYTLGRMFTYILIAGMIVWFGINAQIIALPLQKYGERLLGPFLILLGVIMFDVIKIHLWKGSGRLDSFKESLSKKGYAGSFLLGAVFALAFCPFSAVLFFGMLIPLAINAHDAIVIPSVFAFATGLPVIILSIILAVSLHRLVKVMKKIQTIEKWTRKIVAGIFIIVGIYYTITHTIL